MKSRITADVQLETVSPLTLGFTVADMWRESKTEWPKRSRSPRDKYTTNKKPHSMWKLEE
jgi:hypothetical protein